MDNQQERLMAAIWLGAIIQGEGSVMVYWNPSGRNKQFCISARIVIYNSDMAVIDKVVECIKQFDINPYLYKYAARGIQKKEMITVMINGYKRLVKILPDIIPWLVGEKQIRAKFLYELASKRVNVGKLAPYTEDELEGLRKIFHTAKTSKSSTTNTPNTEEVKIESGL